MIQKNIKIDKYLKLFTVSLFMVLFFGIFDVRADFADCGITQVDPVWEIRNDAGDRVLAIDSNGNMDVVSNSINLETAPPGLFTGSLLLQSDSGNNIFAFNSSESYISAKVFSNQNQSTLDDLNSNENLVIKNDLDVTVARFDTSDGNIYIGGSSCGVPVNQIGIDNCEELQAIAYNDSWITNTCGANCSESSYPLDGDYILNADIDCINTNGSGVWGVQGFYPIGVSGDRFTGTFDGNNKIISDLYIDRSANNIGLFGFASSSAISDLGIVNADIKGSTNVGILIGRNSGSEIKNSYTTGVVSGVNKIGGLIGLTRDGGLIENSYSIVDVSGDNRVGGLIGRNNGSQIDKTYSAGKVTSSGYVGGLIGITSDDVYNSYWDTEQSSQSSCAEGKNTCGDSSNSGLTSAQMTSQTNYSSWSFLPSADAEWKMDTIIPSGEYYPCLSWQDDTTCKSACGLDIIYEGEVYPTVKIGTQCWFAKNLNVGNRVNKGNIMDGENGSIDKYCFNDNEDNCDNYGGLYQLREAIQSNTPVEGVQGICPGGWHVPSDSEWYILENYNSSSVCNADRPFTWDQCSPAGTRLKPGGSSGFNIQWGGFLLSGTNYAHSGSFAYIMSTTNRDNNYYYIRMFTTASNQGDNVNRHSYDDKTGLSVRCIQN